MFKKKFFEKYPAFNELTYLEIFDIYSNDLRMQNKFYIKDCDVSNYLGINLATLRKRLNNALSKNKRFLKNVDYIRIRTGISNYVNYMLNYCCFEKIVISSDSPKSEDIQSFFFKSKEFLINN